MNEMLDFVKAMSSPDRLRIIGLLSQTSATRTQIAAHLRLSVRDSLNHVAFLEDAGLLARESDGSRYWRVRAGAS